MHANTEISGMTTAELLDIVKELADEVTVEQDTSYWTLPEGPKEKVSPLNVGDLLKEMDVADPQGALYAVQVLLELYTRAGYEDMTPDSLDETQTLQEVLDELLNDPELKVTAAGSPSRGPLRRHGDGTYQPGTDKHEDCQWQLRRPEN